jgi:hypothetical protein
MSVACPCCHRATVLESLPGHYGRAVDLDVCMHCNVIWFDELEHVQLSGPATLKLVRDMHERHAFDRVVEISHATCPRCDSALRTRADRQRNVEFQSHVCVHGHGHFLTFYDFLKSKDMLRPLRGQDLKRLREQVGSVSCTNCGAPVDLHTETACGHCSSPLMLLDPQALEKAVGRIQAEEQRKADTSPEMVALEMALAKEKTEAAYRRMETQDRVRQTTDGFDLVHIVLEVLTVIW